MSTTKDAAAARMQKPSTGMYGDDTVNPFADSEPIDEGSELVQALRAELEQVRHELASKIAIAPDNALVPTEDGMRALGRFRFAKHGLIAPLDASKDELQIVAEFLKEAQGALQFWLGDIANAFHSQYGVLAKDLAVYFEIDAKTLQNWSYVCKNIPFPLRNGSVGFSHHIVVAHMPDSLKGREEELLKYAETTGVTVRDFRQHIKTLLDKKPRLPSPAAVLFSKERIPSIGDMRATYQRARKGDDDNAINEMRLQVEKYEAWLKEIRQALGIK